MDEQSASVVVIAIATILFMIWATAFRFMLRATRERQSLSEETADKIGSDSPTPAGTITGSAEVAGSPEALAAKLAERLARDGLGLLGPIKITGADRREVRFESLGGIPGGFASTQGGLRQGVIRFSSAGNKTRIEYQVEAGSSRVLLAFGWLFIALGLAAIVVGVCLEFILVIPSPQPSFRIQAVQMFQAVHLVWPPFLFAQLLRQPVKMIRNQFDALINNLPYA
jgi:hypothetical protein